MTLLYIKAYIIHHWYFEVGNLQHNYKCESWKPWPWHVWIYQSIRNLPPQPIALNKKAQKKTKTLLHMPMELQVLYWNSYTNVVGPNQLMGLRYVHVYYSNKKSYQLSSFIKYVFQDQHENKLR